MNGFSKIGWAALALLGAVCLGVVALRQGEQISALWIVVAAVSIYLVAYRYYSLYIAKNVMGLDPTRATPAHINNDGLDYVPTNKHVLFGHHFAAIAGAGPLVGPVLAAQMGYLPGMLWLIAGVVLAGAVQDFMVLFISSRRDGRSLGDLVREEMGPVAGTIALFGAFLIMIIILAVLAMIVVKALAESPWGMFTVMATLPIAMFMGVYMRYIRPGKIGEISVIGVILLLAAIWLGGKVGAHPTWGPAFTFTGTQITWMLIGEVVAEQHVLVGGHVVQAIVVQVRRRGPARVQPHHVPGDVQAVVAIGDQVDRHRRHHDPQRADLLALAQGHGTQAERAQQGERGPADRRECFHGVRPSWRIATGSASGRGRSILQRPEGLRPWWNVQAQHHVPARRFTASVRA